MARVIHCSAVQQDQVLIGTAASNINTGTTLAGIPYAGQQLQSFKDINFAKQRRHFFYLLYRERNPAHLCIFYIILSFG